MQSQTIALVPGQQVTHPTWGVGLVLNVEGTGPRAQAHIQFPGMTVWIVIAHFPIAIIHNRTEE
jgi:DNA helicase-2/ATP-dependent DNA helicase PcrA